MNKLYIVSGANGSGKTTFAKTLVEEISIQFINADEIAKELNPDDTLGGKTAAGKIFFKRVYELLASQTSFAVESTLSGKYLVNLIKKAQALGYEIELVYIFLENPDVCIERIKERVLNGGHHVPDDDVIRRYYRSKENFWNVYKTLVDKWFLIYNSELSFKEFCIGAKDRYSIIDHDVFTEYMKDISNG